VTLDRRQLLVRTGLALSAAGFEGLWQAPAQSAAAGESPRPTWAQVRAEFALDPNMVHLGGLLLASHPRPVRLAIERHRRTAGRLARRFAFTAGSARSGSPPAFTTSTCGSSMGYRQWAT
jgi:hypothetical protein